MSDGNGTLLTGADKYDTLCISAFWFYRQLRYYKFPEDLHKEMGDFLRGVQGLGSGDRDNRTWNKHVLSYQRLAKEFKPEENKSKPTITQVQILYLSAKKFLHHLQCHQLPSDSLNRFRENIIFAIFSLVCDAQDLSLLRDTIKMYTTSLEKVTPDKNKNFKPTADQYEDLYTCFLKFLSRQKIKSGQIKVIGMQIISVIFRSACDFRVLSILNDIVGVYSTSFKEVTFEENENLKPTAEHFKALYTFVGGFLLRVRCNEPPSVKPSENFEMVRSFSVRTVMSIACVEHFDLSMLNDAGVYGYFDSETEKILKPGMKHTLFFPNFSTTDPYSTKMFNVGRIYFHKGWKIFSPGLWGLYARYAVGMESEGEGLYTWLGIYSWEAVDAVQPVKYFAPGPFGCWDTTREDQMSAVTKINHENLDEGENQMSAVIKINRKNLHERNIQQYWPKEKSSVNSEET